MGNSRGRAVYEANLPDGFLRPQNDQALEQFIRAKYEKKKYIAQEYVPENPPEYPEGWSQLIEAEKQKKDIRKLVLPSHTRKDANGVVTSGSSPSNPTKETARPKGDKTTPNSGQKNGAVKLPAAANAPVSPKPQSTSAQHDLLGLGLGTPANTGFSSLNNTSEADFLGLGKIERISVLQRKIPVN